MNKMKNMLFVYGTLKRGLGNHYVLDQVHAEFVCEAVTSEAWPLTDQDPPLPCLYPVRGAGKRVHGEIYCLPRTSSFRRLDALEGHPNLYRRDWIEVVDLSGNIVKVWAYFYQGTCPHDAEFLHSIR